METRGSGGSNCSGVRTGRRGGRGVAALAREDAEARVRRAAVSRLDDVGVLGEVARTDPDEEVRAEAIRNLAGLATESGDIGRAAEIGRSSLPSDGTKEVVVIACDSTNPDVRAAVVDLIADQRSLASVSRHGPDGQTRLRALSRITDAEEIVNVAIKSEQTDAAMAALERIEDTEALGTIAQRARNKVATRRARTRHSPDRGRRRSRPGRGGPGVRGGRQRAIDLLRRPKAWSRSRIPTKRLPRSPRCGSHGPNCRPTSESTPRVPAVRRGERCRARSDRGAPAGARG